MKAISSQQYQMPKEIDYTALSTFTTCPKKYYFRIIRGIVGKKPPVAAEFGRAIHKALDVWHTQRDIDKAIQVFHDTFPVEIEDEKRTHAVGEKILRLYAEKYEHEPFKVLESERKFSVKIPGTDMMLVGRRDKVVDIDGSQWVLDHKTTSRLGAEFFYKIKPNMQFDGYVYSAIQDGYTKCVGVILDAILVAKGLLIPAQLSKLTPLARDMSYRSELDIQRYIENITQIIQYIERSYEIGVWYDNTESCCDYVECPYRKICKEDVSLHERIIDMDYKVEPWSPNKEDS